MLRGGEDLSDPGAATGGGEEQPLSHPAPPTGAYVGDFAGAFAGASGETTEALEQVAKHEAFTKRPELTAILSTDLERWAYLLRRIMTAIEGDISVRRQEVEAGERDPVEFAAWKSKALAVMNRARARHLDVAEMIRSQQHLRPVVTAEDLEDAMKGGPPRRSKSRKKVLDAIRQHREDTLSAGMSPTLADLTLWISVLGKDAGTTTDQTV